MVTGGVRRDRLGVTEHGGDAPGATDASAAARRSPDASHLPYTSMPLTLSRSSSVNTAHTHETDADGVAEHQAATLGEPVPSERRAGDDDPAWRVRILSRSRGIACTLHVRRLCATD